MATFYDSKDCGADDPDSGPQPSPGSDADVLAYVDMTTPAVWSNDGSEVTKVDLDVFQRQDGSVHVDDEDEFATHQVELGYPPDIIAMAEQSRDEALHAIRRGIAPFDETTHTPWLARLT